MHEKDIFNKALNSNFIIINEEELSLLLNNSEIIRIEDTHLSDFIRIIRYDNDVFIQEMSSKNEIIFRKINSLEEANRFLQKRLDFYERKWDGCGCKIDYYE
jgi:hypothetical protein